MSETTISLPPAAIERIQMLREEMKQLQAAMQQFVDGVLAGMGQDMTQQIRVDLDHMTVTISEPESGQP